MNIFDKRPLSLILCIMLGGFVFFEFSDEVTRTSLFTCAIVFTLISAALLILKKKNALMLISGVALLVSMLCSHLYFDIWFSAEKRFDDNVTVSGTVISLEHTEYSTACVIKADNVNSEFNSAYTFQIYLDRNQSDELKVGSCIEFKADIVEFNDDSKSYRYSDGISSLCENITDLKVTGEEKFVLSAALDNMRKNLTRYAIMMSDEECGTMISALLIGERDSISSKVRLDFKRLGITHLLALSGLHLAIISMALNLVLSKFKVKKGARVAVISAFTASYMIFTGLSPSVCRAGLMLLISSLLYFLSRDSDSITSLFISVFIIVAIAPYSIYDISLWLSAFATLGVIIFAEWQQLRKKKTSVSAKFLRKLIDGLAFSAFAITPTLFISYFIFDGISILSPISTLIFTIPVEIIMYLGSLMMIIGSVIPVGYILSPIVRFTTLLAETLSKLDVYVTTKPWISDVLVFILSIAFFLFAIVKIKRKKQAVFAILIIFTSLFVILGVYHKATAHNELLAYHTENKQDEFVIISEDEAYLISSSQHSKKSGYASIDTLSSLGITKLKRICFANLSRGLDENLTILLSNILIDEIFVPIPRNDDERAIIDKLNRLSEKYSATLVEYSDVDHISAGDYEIIPIHSVPYGDDTAQNAFFIHGNDCALLYLSSGMLADKTKSLSLENINHATAVIFGSHGKKYKYKTYFEAESPNLSKIVFSGENLFVKQDTAIFYNENGCEIISHPNMIIFSD